MDANEVKNSKDMAHARWVVECELYEAILIQDLEKLIRVYPRKQIYYRLTMIMKHHEQQYLKAFDRYLKD